MAVHSRSSRSSAPRGKPSSDLLSLFIHRQETTRVSATPPPEPPIWHEHLNVHFFIFSTRADDRNDDRIPKNFWRIISSTRSDSRTAARRAWKTVRASCSVLPLRAPSINNKETIWAFHQFLACLDGNTGAETATLVELLCREYSWICVKPLAETLPKLIRAAAKRPLTPIVVSQFFRTYVFPTLESVTPTGLSPDDTNALASYLKQPSLGWSDLRNIGGILSHYSVANPYLISIGQLLTLAENFNWHLGWSRRLEKDPRYDQPFCRFCWRIRIPNRRYCRVHSTKIPSRSIGADDLHREWLLQGDYYRYGHLLKDAFDTQMATIVRSDKKAGNRDTWERLEGSSGLQEWVSMYRPNVYRALSQIIESPEAFIHLEFRKLYFLLNGASTGSSDTQHLAKSVKMAPRFVSKALLYDMLQRAEAWLTAATVRRKRWGGKNNR